MGLEISQLVPLPVFSLPSFCDVGCLIPIVLLPRPCWAQSAAIDSGYHTALGTLAIRVVLGLALSFLRSSILF